MRTCWASARVTRSRARAIRSRARAIRSRARAEHGCPAQRDPSHRTRRLRDGGYKRDGGYVRSSGSSPSRAEPNVDFLRSM